MSVDNGSPSQPGVPDDRTDWPVVSPNDIGIAELDSDLAYLGYYLKIEICNYSPYPIGEPSLSLLRQTLCRRNNVPGREIAKFDAPLRHANRSAAVKAGTSVYMRLAVPGMAIKGDSR